MGDIKRGFTYAEAAYYLGIGPDLVKKLARDSELPVAYIKSKPVILREDLDQYLESRPSEKP